MSLFSRVPRHSFTLSRSRRSLKRFCSYTSPQEDRNIPLQEKYHIFLSEIKDHGSGSVVLRRLPEEENIVDISLSNPDKRNCLSGRMICQLMKIIDELCSDDPQHDKTIGLLLRGCDKNDAPPAFCAGLDFSLAKDIINSSEKGLVMCTMMTEALSRLRRLNIVSLALIHGPALGGGAELATACDYRLITDHPSSKIGFVHARIGASPGWGGGKRLLDIVGRGEAIRLLGTAKVLSPFQALNIKLVDGTIAHTELNDTPRVSAGWVKGGIRYLKPFIDMPYSGAVKDLKCLISDLSEINCGGEDKNVEKNMFKRRWASEENRAALATK